MTKRVRIENADTSNYKLVVQIWDKGRAGTEDTPPGPDTLVKEINLDHPTSMTGEDCYIHSGRYIVVKEAA